MANELTFPQNLVEHQLPMQLYAKQKEQFDRFYDELTVMHVEFKTEPTTESLTNLYRQQAVGRAYFERASEIYRQYLRYCSTITMMYKQANFTFSQLVSQCREYAMQQDQWPKLKAQADREEYVKSFIPESLKIELFSWEMLNDSAKTNFKIIQNFSDQFKSVREDVLVQLSIVKQLITLGNIKVDQESLATMRALEDAMKPTEADLSERTMDSPFVTPEQLVSMSDGMVSLSSTK